MDGTMITDVEGKFKSHEGRHHDGEEDPVGELGGAKLVGHLHARTPLPCGRSVLTASSRAKLAKVHKAPKGRGTLGVPKL